MGSSTIRPPVTLRIREFLDIQGAGVKPWSGLDETYGYLYALLNEKKNDPSFWPHLQSLLGELVADLRYSGDYSQLPSPHAELLSSCDVEALVRNLREALPGTPSDGPSETGRRHSPALPLPLAALFLLLVVAVNGCDEAVEDDASAIISSDSWTATDADTGTSSDIDVDTDADSDGDVDTSAYDGCDPASSPTVANAIDSSGLSVGEKNTLCGCLDTLNDSWNAGLTELFETESPEVIAGVLEHLIVCCDNGIAVNDEFSDDVRQALIDQYLCYVVIYKGVSFPDP